MSNWEKGQHPSVAIPTNAADDGARPMNSHESVRTPGKVQAELEVNPD